MPKQVNTQITGRFGPDIYYKRGDEYLVRAKGNTGKQAEVARQQAGILGKASAISASLRAVFKPLMVSPKSRTLMYRFNNVLQQWLRSGQSTEAGHIDSIAALQGFSFDSNSRTNDFYIAMPVSRTSNNELLLHIPALDSPNPIYPLPFHGQIRLHVIAASCNVAKPAEIISYETTVEINYSGIAIAAQQVLLPVQTKAGYLTVVALLLNETAGGIVGAVYN
jgi:hypothetical protein